MHQSNADWLRSGPEYEKGVFAGSRGGKNKNRRSLKYNMESTDSGQFSLFLILAFTFSFLF